MRVLLALLLLTGSAFAQQTEFPRCAPHDEMAALLLSKAKESPVRMSINKDRALIETYASPKGSWTDVKTDMLTGESCITDWGTNIQIRLVPKPEQGA